MLRTRLTALAVSAVLAAAFAGGLAQTAKPGAKMKEFALLFRTGTQNLSEAQIQERSERVRAWAIKYRDEGRLVYSRILGAERSFTNNGSDKEAPVGAFVIFMAESLEDAAKTVKTHPSIDYGGTIEIRQATNPAAPPPSG